MLCFPSEILVFVPVPLECFLWYNTVDNQLRRYDMAWILGSASEQEVTSLRKAGYEVTTLEARQETALFGGVDEERSDSMVMVWVDCDVVDLTDLHSLKEEVRL